MSVKDIKKKLNTVSNLKRKKANEWFFKTGKGEYGEGDKFIGVSMPDLRKVAKKYIDLPLKKVEELLHSKVHEHRMTALVIWTYKYETASKAEQKQIYSLYLKNTKYINNWDLVDVTTPRIVGMYLLDKDRSVLHKLAKSKELWEKRIAILATFAFIDKAKESKDALVIAELLLKDTHDLIHKAVGWMLREVGKRVSQAEEERFLKKHYKTMPRTMLRYSIERFSDSKKRFYMKK